MGDTPKFYIDPAQAGVVRGGWFDEMGGMLVGVHAEKVCTMLNEHPEMQATIERVRGLQRYEIDADYNCRLEAKPDSRGDWVKWSDLLADMLHPVNS